MITRLEAVNEMLAAIGESPVSSLASGLPEAEDAEDTLDRVSKAVQAKGWYCNRETLELALDINGQIKLSDTILRIDTVERDRLLEVRPRKDGQNLKLWRVKERSFVFDRAPLVEIVWHLPFVELTYELQAYVVARAAKKFQSEDISSQALDQFLVRDETEALAALEDAETEAEDSNVLRDSEYARRLVNRYNPPLY